MSHGPDDHVSLAWPTKADTRTVTASKRTADDPFLPELRKRVEAFAAWLHRETGGAP